MGSTEEPVPSSSDRPLFSFGVISDVQYADIPDGCSFHGVPRYYRHSVSVLQRAVEKWNSSKNINFAVNFGDIVDGLCPKDQSLGTVTKIAREFGAFNGPVYHMIGNHCLYNLPRDKLLPILKIASETDHRAYYEFSPVPEYRFIVLDGYDISAIGWPEDHPTTIQAMKILEKKNPNAQKNMPTGLVGLDRRFVMFNGGMGREQLEWLDSVLRSATESNQKAIICCHLPLDPGAASPEALPWNYDEVLGVIRRYKCVKAFFSGHDHRGGHSVDAFGVHHHILEAALECPPGRNAYGRVDAYEDRLLLIGTDRMKSCEIVFTS